MVIVAQCDSEVGADPGVEAVGSCQHMAAADEGTAAVGGGGPVLESHLPGVLVGISWVAIDDAVSCVLLAALAF